MRLYVIESVSFIICRVSTPHTPSVKELAWISEFSASVVSLVNVDVCSFAISFRNGVRCAAHVPCFYVTPRLCPRVIFRKPTAPLPSSYTESPDELGSAPEVSINASHIHNVKFSRNHSKKNKEKQLRLILISLKFIFTHLAAPRLSCCLWGLVPRTWVEPRPPALGAQS